MYGRELFKVHNAVEDHRKVRVLRYSNRVCPCSRGLRTVLLQKVLALATRKETIQSHIFDLTLRWK